MDEGKEKNIDSKQKRFEQEQDATLQQSSIASQTGAYQDPISKVIDDCLRKIMMRYFRVMLKSCQHHGRI